MDGIIKLDSDFGKKIGFISKYFSSGSYLWKEENTIIISFISSVDPGKGHFSALLKAIEERKYKIQVPTPMFLMRKILEKKGFKSKHNYCQEMGDYVEIMEK